MAGRKKTQVKPQTTGKQPRSRAPQASGAQGHEHHGHSKAQCLKILKNLSAYLDDDLSASVCGEIRKHLGACPNCEVFVDSLRQTVGLCRQHQPPPLSLADKQVLHREILRAAGL